MNGGWPVTLPTKRIRGIETLADLDLRPLGGRFDRLQPEYPLDHRAAISMNIAHGRADLRVAIAGDRLLDEVDEASLALHAASKLIASLRTAPFRPAAPTLGPGMAAPAVSPAKVIAGLPWVTRSAPCSFNAASTFSTPPIHQHAKKPETQQQSYA